MIQILNVVLVLACFVFIYFGSKRPTGVPPGPLKFPFIGNFPQLVLGLAIDRHNGVGGFCLKGSKFYGPSFSANIASYSAVVLNSAYLVREAFALPQLSGRPALEVSNVRTGGRPRGLIFNVGQSWTEQRRFAMRHLKDFGVGKNTMEGLILDEAQDLVATLRKTAGTAVSTDVLFNVAIINSLWAVVAGQRFKHDNPKLLKLVSCVTKNLAETGVSGAMVFMPTLAKLFPKLSGWNDYLDAFKVTRAFITEFVEYRIKTHKSGHCNDFTDAYIEQIMSTTDPNSSFFEEEGVQNLVTTLDDLFSAGGETTSTTLTWFLLCLAVNPHVQEKFQLEIDNVIGRGRLPTLADRPRMPYTEAITSEVLRISAVVHVGVIHSATEDVVFRNFLIPKDTMVVSNLHGIHHDPDVWTDPHTFCPERFLGSDGVSPVNQTAFVPFSTGRRICPGEGLARDEIFLIATLIFREFDVKPDPTCLPSLAPHCQGVVTKPHKHKLMFYPR